MKKIKNIILILVLTIMLGITTNVYAEEINKDSLNYIPETISVDVKEIDYTNDNTFDYINNTIENKIKEKLASNNISINDINISCFAYEVHRANCLIDIYNKDINISYSNSSDEKDIEKKEMQSKAEKIHLKRVYDYQSINFWYSDFQVNYDDFKEQIKNELGDNNLTVYFTGSTANEYIDGSGYGGFIGALIFKNDLLYANVMLPFDAISKYTLENGKTILMRKIASNQTDFEQMKKQIDKKENLKIIHAYELELESGTISNKERLKIPCSPNYNGKNILILHKKSDNTYEEFNTKVKDGFVTIEVTELSPFMIALNDDTNNAVTEESNDNSNTVTEVKNAVSNNAQTSSIDIVLLSILSISSLSGIIYLVLRKKKIA